MGNPIPVGDAPYSQLVEEFRQIKLRLAELEAPTGTQIANAVANLTSYGSAGASSIGFAIPTVMATVASGTLVVPAGFTKATMHGTVSAGAWNGSATGDYLYVQCILNGSPGATMPVFAGASAYGSVSASAIRTLTGLTPGSTIVVGVQCKASSGWGTNTSNIANVDVTVSFSR